jgi:hypothetical protein
MTKDPNEKKAPAGKAQSGYSGKIPTAAIVAFEQELAGLIHGTASLVIYVRDGRLTRFTTGRERSHMAEQAAQLLTGGKK